MRDGTRMDTYPLVGCFCEIPVVLGSMYLLVSSIGMDDGQAVKQGYGAGM